MLIYISVSSRLDSCVTLYICVNKRNIQRLQLIQNATDRLLSHTKRIDHITSIFAALHLCPLKGWYEDFDLTIDLKKKQNETVLSFCPSLSGLLTQTKLTKWLKNSRQNPFSLMVRFNCEVAAGCVEFVLITNCCCWSVNVK